MAKSLMIQGTMSSVGKSLLTAGLCRVLYQDGYKVAPFKSQNMALNSFITSSGYEMGRAQVMQAEFANVEPDVRMNPILLKPTGAQTSQVIVNGEVLDNMAASEYYKMKKVLEPKIKEAYDSLASEYDVILLEGAGSPVEINLKENDIVNMGMCKLSNSPVVLVGDIDRGGIFATLYGTKLLYAPDEQKYLKGTIINKFRGDIALLTPGVDTLNELMGVPCLGVIPHMSLNIDDEDSLSNRFDNNKTYNTADIDIAVIRLPHISNYTDFNPFEIIDGVSLRYVGSRSEIGSPDLLIIPGTKNTIYDMQWLRNTGLELDILNHAESGKPIFGVCGGYQMLGLSIKDACNAEGGGELSGLGLLECSTTFEATKTRTQVKGSFKEVTGIFRDLTSKEFTGYEIHMGVTTGLLSGSSMTTVKTQEGQDKDDGLHKANIYGSYVHGIFDNGVISETIIKALLKDKGLPHDHIKSVDITQHKEKEYNRVADVLRENLNMKEIYNIINQGV